ncbi:MAG: substrate-binding domain-containing protein [Sphaerochaeta sp.]
MRRIGAFIICVLLLTGCTPKETHTNPHIAVITMMQGGEFWGALKNGARSARSATSSVLEFFGPINEADYEGQVAAVNLAIDQHFDAIILSPSHYTRLAEAVTKARSKVIKVVLADTALKGQSADFLITADYRTIGQQMAEHAFTLFEPAEQINALIIGSLPNTTTMTNLVESLSETLRTRPNTRIISSTFSFSDESIARSITHNALQVEPKINVIFALEENTAHGVALAIEQHPAPINFIALGNTRYEIQLLEEGVIDALVVVNAFNLGYRSVLASVQLLDGKKPAQQPVDFALVTKETMFTEEHQRLVFQTVQ